MSQLSSLAGRLGKLPARTGFFYRNLVTGESYAYNADEEMYAASVIKLFILACTMQKIGDGVLRKDTEVVIRKDGCVPSCGALTYMHDGLRATVQDLYNLMVILSDNTATNYLIDLLGKDEVNACIRSLGFEHSTLRRKMYETELSRRGIQNTITAREVGELLTMMYEGTLVSPEASAEMLSVMKEQQINHKIPFYLFSLPDPPEIAHKTGEDDGITHDCGIVYAREPFVLAFTFNDADVPACERAMAEIALELYRDQDTYSK